MIFSIKRQNSALYWYVEIIYLTWQTLLKRFEPPINTYRPASLTLYHFPHGISVHFFHFHIIVPCLRMLLKILTYVSLPHNIWICFVVLVERSNSFSPYINILASRFNQVNHIWQLELLVWLPVKKAETDENSGFSNFVDPIELRG